MQTRIEKSGDNLTVCIPPSLAAQGGIAENAVVEVSLVDGKLVISPVQRRAVTLAELLDKITDENLHGEWDTGPAVGRESW